MKQKAPHTNLDSTEAVTITIGRNIGATPMSAFEWSRFKRDIRESLERCGATLWVDSEGVGPWDSGFENNHVFVGAVEHVCAPLLRHELARLALTYRQVCIGLLVGHSELVAAGDLILTPELQPLA